MKDKKVKYFPYLPYSQIEDNKRCQNIIKEMERDPFTFHKKKFSFINLCHTNKEKNIGENQELFFFQKWHDKNINSYNNYMKRKASTIEANTRNYLKFMSHRNIINLRKSRNENYYNPIKENINSNINDISKLNHCNSNLNINNKEKDKKELNFNNKKNQIEEYILKKSAIELQKDERVFGLAKNFSFINKELWIKYFYNNNKLITEERLAESMGIKKSNASKMMSRFYERLRKSIDKFTEE